MLRLNISFIANDENNGKKKLFQVGDQIPSYFHYTKVTYLSYADPLNLQNNICQINTQQIK